MKLFRRRTDEPPPSARAIAWRAVPAHIPIAVALLAVAAVWVFGAIWSFTEQRAFAIEKTFTDPALLPLVIDGLAVATACLAFAASLDARPAVFARLGTAFAVTASAAFNGWWAVERSLRVGALDPAMIIMGVCVPIFAYIALEVLLAELRRQVWRARGMPAPPAVPTLRLVRLVLAPLDTFSAWRTAVLAVTAPVVPAPVPPTPRKSAQPPRLETELPPQPWGEQARPGRADDNGSSPAASTPAPTPAPTPVPKPAPTTAPLPTPDSVIERSDDELMDVLRAIRDRDDPAHPAGVLPPQAVVREEVKVGFRRLRRLLDRLKAEQDELRRRRGA
jgi:hypothetical protein